MRQKDQPTQLDANIFPRGECLNCKHQWKPRRTGSGKITKACPQCASQYIKVWDANKVLVREGKKEVDTPSSSPLENIFLSEEQQEIAQDTHVRFSGVEAFKQVSAKNNTLLTAEGYKLDMEVDQFVEHLLKIHNDLFLLKVNLQIDVTAENFAEGFAGLYNKAKKSHLVEKISKEIKEENVLLKNAMSSILGLRDFNEYSQLMNTEKYHNVERILNNTNHSDLDNKEMEGLV